MNSLVEAIQTITLQARQCYIEELKKYTQVTEEEIQDNIIRLQLEHPNTCLNLSAVSTFNDYEHTLNICKTLQQPSLIICTYENTYKQEDSQIEVCGIENFYETIALNTLKQSALENSKFLKASQVVNPDKLIQLGFVRVANGEMYSKPEYVNYCEFRLGFSPLGELETKIMDILELGTFSSKEIAKELGLKVRGVNSILKELITEGFVIKSSQIKQGEEIVRTPMYDSIANV